MATIVVGQSDYFQDLSAVQAAVNQGGDIVLKESFLFRNTETVFVRTAVNIYGNATISGGAPPFTVKTSQAVTIEGITFNGVTKTAIDVQSVNGLRIARCAIKGVAAVEAGQLRPVAVGIVVSPPALDPETDGPGGPVIGNLELVGNNIDVGGTDQELTLGIFVLGAGTPGSNAIINISGNTVRNTTRHGIDVRNIVGSAIIEGNTVNTGAIGAQIPDSTTDQFVNGIRCLGAGTYTIHDNDITCDFPNAAGIRLQGSPTTSIKSAQVFGNRLFMNMKVLKAMFGPESAGIEIRRGSTGASVHHNTIHGNALSTLSLVATGDGVPPAPESSTLSLNNVDDFKLPKRLFIGLGANETTIQGYTGKIENHGTNTHTIE
jgi:hypothetical protein